MQPSEEIRALAGMLHGDPTAGSLPSERQHELLLMGVVVSLEEIAASSPPYGSHSDQQVDNPAQEVVQILQAAAAANASSGVRLQAYQALLRLAQGSLPLAVDAIYRLAVEENLLAARQAIITNHWQPANAGLRALFDWFLHLEAGKPFPEESLPVLTQAYFSEASPLLQRRLLSTAVQNRAENWARIINAVQSSGPAALAELVDRYPQYRPTERQIAIEQLTHLASRGSPAARDALAQLFLRYEDSQARGIILEQDYLPDDAHGRALIFFLAEDWQRYNTLDFDHSLLVDAYEQAGRSLRRRLLEHSRHTGQIDWLRGLSGVPVPESEVRWLNDLTDADWELAIRRLTENDKPGELWRLAQVAPPIWSAAILARLEKRGWLPEAAEESTSFANLSQLAAGVLAKPLDVRPVKALYAPINEITCLAMHPNGASLAAGSSDQRVFLWSLPDGTLQEPPIMGPAPVTRAMAFNPDGSLLVCAGGDNRIRVFVQPVASW